MRSTSTILFFLIALAYAGTSALAVKAEKFIPHYKLQVMDLELAKAHAQAVQMMEVTAAPTMEPTAEPMSTDAPTLAPTVVPTLAPTVAPTLAPTVVPTQTPTVAPTIAPTTAPTVAPSVAPTTATIAPTVAPTTAPTVVPTQAPSLLPTKAPTLTPAPTTAPTQQVQPILTFQSTVGLKGVTGTTLDQADKDAIVQSCAAAMGVSKSSVTFVSATLSTARKLRSASAKSNVALLNNFDVVISTSVPTTTGAANTDYAALTSLLTADNINAQLQTYAVENGASNLLGASADTVVSEPAVITEPKVNDNNDDDELSGGAIAGIVIGVVVGVGLIVGLLWYFLVQKESTGMADKSKLDIDVGL